MNDNARATRKILNSVAVQTGTSISAYLARLDEWERNTGHLFDASIDAFERGDVETARRLKAQARAFGPRPVFQSEV